MTFVAPESAHTPTLRIPSIALLGADALLAALPATPVQLAHACMLAGYQNVVPSSWGDELIAAAAMRSLERFGELPAVQCSCPFVAHRLLAAGADLRPFLVSLVAPPVALARYLRAAHAGKLRITYVGRCPGAADESIDARLTPEELLAIFSDRGIVLEEQPRVFDSVIPPDRRRYRSQPGGLPAPEMLWTAGSGTDGGRRSLVELHGEELPMELAQHLLAGKPVLIDVAGKLGCLCSGAAPGADMRKIRSSITALEPPRAPSPVIDERIHVELELPLPASPRSAIDVVSPPSAAVARVTVAESGGAIADVPGSNGDPHARGEDRPIFRASTTMDAAHGSVGPRRLSPPRGVARAMSGTLPTARDANGRQLPRTYVARRRSPSRSGRSSPADSPPTPATAVETGALTSGSAMSVAVEPEVAEAPQAAAPAPASNATTGSAAPVAETRSAVDAATITQSTVVPKLALDQSTSLASQPITGSGGSGGGGGAAAGGASVEVPPPSIGRAPLPLTSGDEAAESARYRERPVKLPVTPRSDAAKRELAQATPAASGERPLAQLLVFALLIATIVLVSAAVGVVVGRWMAQR